MIENILFDLDGTLTEPKEGIVRCIEYALEKMNRPIPAGADFSQYIGPPLQTTFCELLETTDKEVIDTAVAFFRERFRKKGQYENRVYDGIEKLLATLSRHKKLFIATSKPEVFAVNIIDHFNLSHYFSGVYGAQLDGTRSDKGALLKFLIEKETLDPSATIMIGDRRHDILGARANTIESIGVLWGYGTKTELESANATWLCSDISFLENIIK